MSCSSIWKESGKGNLLIGLLKGPPIKTFRTDAALVTLFLIYIFSYFETEVVGKSARNNPVRFCSVVLSSLFFQGMDVCLWVLKESNKSRFDSCSVRNSTDWSCTILPFGIVARTFFPTTFLKIAVYKNNHWSPLLLDECLNEKLIRSHHGHHAISYAMFNCFLELRTESWEVIRWDGYTLQ